MSATLPTLYQDFIHLSRYARWLDESKRRETWEETVDRYIDFMCHKCPAVSTRTRTELREAIINLEVMPSMRAMMTAGPALERDNVAGYNCFAGETLVTTKEYGITPIENLAGQDVHVVDGDGQWTEAPCRSFGKQAIWEVALATSGRGSDWTIRSTEEHQWVLRDGTRKTTKELAPGDKLAFVRVPEVEGFNRNSRDYCEGVIHGIVFGDGTANYKQKQQKRVCKGFAIRLCGDHEDLLPYFNGRSVSYPPSFEGDPVVYLMGDDAAIDMKSLPDDEWFTRDYLKGFVCGWLAADGSVGKSGQVSICVQQEAVDWLYRHGPALGFVPRRHYRMPEETSLGARSNSQYCVEFDRRYLQEEDILIGRKRSRFKRIDSDKNPGFGKVASVKRTGDVEHVYCFTVPTTQSFMLSRNLLTGNCSYLAIDHIQAFDEMLYILMCGSGVGFSAERQFIANMPTVASQLRASKTTIHVEDSKLGWANAFREMVSMLYQGRVPQWDVSAVRPAGARLVTFGGRASGPEPLEDLFRFTIKMFKDAAGRKLTSIECHDLACKIGEVVVVGGVRRSALISLSNLSDDRMRHAKAGNWWETTPWRKLANNSACYTEKPSMDSFMREWLSLYESKSGERGIFNRVAARNQVAKYGRRDPDHQWGCNPCSEIILRPDELCNLTEVVVRPGDNLRTLQRKVRLATILGTMQSTLTTFRYLRDTWKQNTEEERLLGVSLTGVMDHALLSGINVNGELAETLQNLRLHAVKTNKEWARKFGIPPSAAITCNKPSGTVSQLVDCSSGIHTRYSPYYIRNVRADKKDPLAHFMAALGFPHEDDVTKPEHNWVFPFPVKSPEGAVTQTDVPALEQLRIWKTYQDHWCEHKPSCTVTVRENEWMGVGAWVYDNFDEVSGISFLPAAGHVYKQAPYQECSKGEYEKALAAMPSEVDWSGLAKFESDDSAVNHRELACSANGGCEIVDLVKE